MKLTLTTPVTQLRMVGPVYSRKLEKLDINTVEDLLLHRPHRYLDYSAIRPISSVHPGEVVTLQGAVIKSNNLRTRYGKSIQKLIVGDGTGQLEATWFNQPYIPNTLPMGKSVSLSGEIKAVGSRIQLVSPEYELLPPEINGRQSSTAKTIHTGRLIPIYPETKGVSSKWLRSRISPVLEFLLPSLNDWLPQEIIEQEGLMPLRQAIRQLHFPDTLMAAERATRRLAFDELLTLELSALMRKRAWQSRAVTTSITLPQTKLKAFLKSLPFKLTQAQRRALGQILDDLASSRPMNRLLLGDVGSGKTVVAAIAMYAAYLSRTKSMIMAPTEILALQHERTIAALLKPHGVKVALVTGSYAKGLAAFDVAIGTHALLYDRMKEYEFGLVVIDEQHRFGVEQRSKLVLKESVPHTLTMTATPIPRTVALTIYGDLDLSLIDEMPPGRQRVKTWVVPPVKRQAAYAWIRERIRSGEQAFIVCPLIEESQHETMQQVKAASDEYARLAKDVFPEFPLGLLHGRLPAATKERVISSFRSGKTTILVTTPVVEVGIDIPLATIMMIEGAERFGLAQLHQLRGRVGRGNKESYCLLFSSKPRSGMKRLKALETTKSGSDLAQLDLALRGPGEIFGVRQHGYAELTFTDLGDTAGIAKARAWARKILEEDPQLLRHTILHRRLRSLEKNVQPN